MNEEHIDDILRPEGGITNAGMADIRKQMEDEFAADDGAMSVDYDEFKQIYNYVSRYVNRNENKAQNILFTISGRGGCSISDETIESCMFNLNRAVVSSLRKVDVGTIFSKNQYIVILTDTDMVNAEMVADRVTKLWEQLCGPVFAELTYEIQTIMAQSRHHLY